MKDFAICTAGSWHVEAFFKILKKKKALLHIRTSAFYGHA